MGSGGLRQAASPSPEMPRRQRQGLTPASGRFEVDIGPAVNRRRITRPHVEDRHVPGALQAGSDGLRCAHPGRDIGLGQTGRQPCVDHFADDGEAAAEAVRLDLDLGTGQQLSRDWL